MSLAIKAATVYLHNEIVHDGYLLIDNGKFASFIKEKPSAHYDVIDYSDFAIAPGLFDTHIHGYNGYDVMDNNLSGLIKMSEDLLSCGVTSFLPTTLTAPINQLDAVIKTIGPHLHEMKGAKAQGIFIEGPFFTEKHKGAQNPDYFMDPLIDILDRWIQLSNNQIKKIAIAPEREGAIRFISHAKKHNIRVALAHTNADYLTAMQAINTGASIFTHTFNGMNGFNHREPGVVGAAFSADHAFAEVICDGHHVHPAAIKTLIKTRGIDETVLISDCMMAGGKPEGQYKLGEFDVFVKDGKATIQTGSLAGSILELKDAVKNLIDWGIVTPHEAIKMASTSPAKSLALHETAVIKTGVAADFIVLDHDFHLHATYIDGHCKYIKE
ncbi:N-acetylglucosamine-6-phosphate deacetylase [Halolactibacillus alkaliphilus]|uniref:N-acetylglucosamine-6-phosphate deacetylase n=1 Tax=Halolactibacillus alkaliphilus TaxID=442899 RepID=A0A511WYL9_9BACI|nr:N-acetylglucosamine-6-phosphate deacetylase [Halolactibacillus alkaliphilus]GEN55631.1 N-acetylglucosamine-6-phosphate deacetylase [Halolactibacillus alkaliphilus]GGN63671.1 N-acetylglucosamine-6-phosphate deacetylase [Halolactibacillus alkaliphilus]SFO62636.1 N-acetylglucosamine-6-phosphate deacetylase [Halolactibacillus alkaliphilus]